MTVVSWGDWPFAVFVTGTDGAIYTTAGNPQGGFPGGWASVAGGRAAPGAPVTVEPWNSQFAVFVTGTDGQIWTTTGDPQAGFRSWVPIPGINAAPGTPVTAVFDGERFAVVAANLDGNVYAAFGTIDDGFTSWAWVSEGTTIPGGHNTGFWNYDGSQMSIFLADQSGGIYVTGTVPPFAPTNLHVTGVTNTTIGIAWVDNSGDQDGFRVSYNGGSFNLPPGDRTANITGLQPGTTYEISVLAFNDVTGISPSSNVITVTTGDAPQTVQMTLNRQTIIEGPVPYLGTFPPFGITQPFHLQKIFVPSNSDVLALRFVKSGHSSEQCGDDNAVVTITAGSSTTSAELDAIFGVTTYPINFTNGLVSLVACVAQPTGAPLLNFINVELTFVFG